MKPSPVNCGAVPPKRSTWARLVARNELTRSRIASAPRRSVKGVDPTMSQNSTVTCFISPGSAGDGGFGYVGLGGGAILQPGSAEQRAALAAKSMLGGIAGSARRTRVAQRSTALSAEPHTGRVVGATPRAPHTEPPRSAGNRMLRSASLVLSRSGGQHLGSAGADREEGEGTGHQLPHLLPLLARL